jgi:6-pyruvoyltetrahydropterin/6-carboxytetrahydropterin synthase
MTYTVRVERNRLRFMSAHMATWEGACEPLHGHNYQLTVEVEGKLTPDSWVIDFSLLKRIARERCEQIDHTFLLQRDSRVLAIEELDDAWQITTPDRRRFQFPKSDVSVLPIDNTTVERLAEWFHAEIAAALQAEGMTNIGILRIEVEEAPGQSGGCVAPIGTRNGV